MKNLIFIFSIIIFIASCNQKHAEQKADINDEQLKVRAQELAHKFIITDGHIDLPYRLRHSGFTIAADAQEIIKTDSGDFDFERAKAGGLDAPFMSIYIPSSYQETGGAKALADSLIDMVANIPIAFPDKFGMAKSTEEVKKLVGDGKIALSMGMENGAPIEEDLANVAYFHDRGIRYITLTHAKDNFICDSSYDTAHTWNGLSPFGREVVKEMNKVGIMIDVSHISDSTFYQVMEICEAPVIASHSSCRHFTPGFERNMSDEMIKLLAEKGGVIQINFGSTFLDANSRDIDEETSKYLEENKLTEDDSLAHVYKKEHPVYSTVQKVADHIDHVVEIAGIDHVGLGSDFDGVGDTLPEGLKDVSQYPNILFHLLKRGYSEEDIEKICYKNVFRVWNAVDSISRKTN